MAKVIDAYTYSDSTEMFSYLYTRHNNVPLAWRREQHDNHLMKDILVVHIPPVPSEEMKGECLKKLPYHERSSPIKVKTVVIHILSDRFHSLDSLH